MCSEDEAEHEDISNNATAHDADGVLPAGYTWSAGGQGYLGSQGYSGWISPTGGLVLLTVPPLKCASSQQRARSQHG